MKSGGEVPVAPTTSNAQIASSLNSMQACSAITMGSQVISNALSFYGQMSSMGSQARIASGHLDAQKDMSLQDSATKSKLLDIESQNIDKRVKGQDKISEAQIERKQSEAELRKAQSELAEVKKDAKARDKDQGKLNSLFGEHNYGTPAY